MRITSSKIRNKKICERVQILNTGPLHVIMDFGHYYFLLPISTVANIVEFLVKDIRSTQLCISGNYKVALHLAANNRNIQLEQPRKEANLNPRPIIIPSLLENLAY